jgi:hypothetical protein
VDADAALNYADGEAAQAPRERADGEASALGVDSTPTFTVRRGDGAESVVAVGTEGLRTKVDQALAG